MNNAFHLPADTGLYWIKNLEIMQHGFESRTGYYLMWGIGFDSRLSHKFESSHPDDCMGRRFESSHPDFMNLWVLQVGSSNPLGCIVRWGSGPWRPTILLNQQGLCRCNQTLPSTESFWLLSLEKYGWTSVDAPATQVCLEGSNPRVSCMSL